jgi:hypothetical protein
VEYDEKVGHRGATRRRAYWLEQNQAKEGAEKRPHFVSVKEDRGLPAIPVFESVGNTNSSPSIGLFALSTNSFGFELCTTGENQNNESSAVATLFGDHELPVYYDSAGRRRKIMLTPPAVLADASIIAGYAAIIAACAYAQSGAAWAPH